MLLGMWDNFADLEEKLNLSELYAILDASRKKEHSRNKFMAALKGVDIDEGQQTSAEERFNEVKNRVDAKLTGRSQASVEFDFFGLDIEDDI
jgi:hypothetical protein